MSYYVISCHIIPQILDNSFRISRKNHPKNVRIATSRLRRARKVQRVGVSTWRDGGWRGKPEKNGGFTGISQEILGDFMILTDFNVSFCWRIFGD